MNTVKPIKTDEDHKQALELLEKLIDKDPKPDTDESMQMEVLATLIEKYESKRFPISPPDPIEAIKFRMDQFDMAQADLIPYFGNRSRVSEVLSGKRPLTLDMIRKIESGLGIPAKVLIKKPKVTDGNLHLENWNTALVREMKANGYLESNKKKPEEQLLKEFFTETNLAKHDRVMLRQSSYATAGTDGNALYAWTIHALKKAKEKTPSTKYEDGCITIEFMKDLVKLSTKEDGPIRAQKRLNEKGITLIIEPHLSKTRLDGAAFLDNKKNPVIGLTLRHDRIDNFWFTLMHELAHIALHLNKEKQVFYDEDIGENNKHKEEEEANEMAREAIVPKGKWEISTAKITPSPIATKMLAEELKIHPAVVAGFIRHETKNYRLLKDMVKGITVRHLFGDISWKKKK